MYLNFQLKIFKSFDFESFFNYLEIVVLFVIKVFAIFFGNSEKITDIWIEGGYPEGEVIGSSGKNCGTSGHRTALNKLWILLLIFAI